MLRHTLKSQACAAAEVAMPDILHDFPIKSPPARVFQAVSTPGGLDAWWTDRSSGNPVEGAEYELWFGPEYDWRARVTRCVPDSEFELQMVRADNDWIDTRVGFRLETRAGGTWVRFYHAGWPVANEHYRISNNCWAMYLRILRRHLEHGESVPYESRLDV
jgi:uncharacterized protein YndB with AHSA1/START domain